MSLVFGGDVVTLRFVSGPGSTTTAARNFGAADFFLFSRSSRLVPFDSLSLGVLYVWWRLRRSRPPVDFIVFFNQGSTPTRE